METLENISTTTMVDNNNTSKVLSAVKDSNTMNEIAINDDFDRIVEEGTANERIKSIELTERKAIIILILIPFSMMGVLIRIGLNTLHTYQGAPVFALVYPQFVGCLIFGFFLARKGFIMESYLPLYTGIQTGLCGSITTFSSWMLLIFQDFDNTTYYSRNGIYDVIAGLADIGIVIGMSIVGLKFGEHLADALMPNQRAPEGLIHRIIVKPSKTKEFIRLDWVCVVIGCVSSALIIVLAGTIKVHQRILLAAVFAPIGTLIRWQLSRFNTLIPSFPLGTFTANICGSAIIGVLFLLRNGTISSGISCEVLFGLSDGFCGCLTTVSTFAAEITTLPRRYAYRYALISIVAGQVTMVFFVGIYSWTNHTMLQTCS